MAMYKNAQGQLIRIQQDEELGRIMYEDFKSNGACFADSEYMNYEDDFKQTLLELMNKFVTDVETLGKFVGADEVTEEQEEYRAYYEEEYPEDELISEMLSEYVKDAGYREVGKMFEWLSTFDTGYHLGSVTGYSQGELAFYMVPTDVYEHVEYDYMQDVLYSTWYDVSVFVGDNPDSVSERAEWDNWEGLDQITYEDGYVEDNKLVKTI